jgi:hypothetical protein
MTHSFGNAGMVYTLSSTRMRWEEDRGLPSLTTSQPVYLRLSSAEAGCLVRPDTLVPVGTPETKPAQSAPCTFTSA